MIRNMTALLTCAILLFLASMAHANMKLPYIFSDHMVLQRDQTNPIWGWADVGTQITLTLAGHTYHAQANEDRSWRIVLKPHKAGGPYDLTIQTTTQEHHIRDLYFGDVWIAGGQSNMEWKLDWKINHGEELIADANYPLIRFFEVPKIVSATPQNDTGESQWKQAAPESVGNFSAIGYLFALHNHLQKNVPVGIVEANWGGTPAEAWVSPDNLLKLDYYRPKTLDIYQEGHDWTSLFAQNERNAQEKFGRLVSEEDALATGAYRFDYPDTNWSVVRLPNQEPFEHLAWLRREVILDQAPNGEAVLNLGELVQEAFIFVNEQLIKFEDWKVQGSLHTLPAGLLKQGRNLIAVRVGNSWDNHPAAGREGQVTLTVNDQTMDISHDWHYSNLVEPPIPDYIRYEWTPGFLYNAMIHPVQGYGIRGVIWYQGEGNTEAASYYGDLFVQLIQDWRQQWQQDFSFLFVQLAGFMEAQYPQPDSQWALLRDMQAQALSLPNTGMATAIDIGEQNDVHPRNKQDVASRLWGEARRVSFHEKVLSQGPTYRRHKVKGNIVSIRFDHVGKGFSLSEGESVKGFILAGADGQYYPAEAMIKGHKIRVWSEQVDVPVSLKYAWADFPEVNLYNSAGLPALPFSIDKL